MPLPLPPVSGLRVAQYIGTHVDPEALFAATILVVPLVLVMLVLLEYRLTRGVWPRPI